MDTSHRSRWVIAAVALLFLLVAVTGAGTRKAEKYYEAGQKAEVLNHWDEALDLYEKALAEEPGNTAYRLKVAKTRMEASSRHVEKGLSLRNNGELDQALAQFEKAYAIDPSSKIAEQELKRTLETMQRNQKQGSELKPELRNLTPAELTHKEEQTRLERIEGPPRLKALSPQPITLRMTNQPARVLFETLAKIAGINVIFDPEYRGDSNGGGRTASIELVNANVENALDDLALDTKSFWKPLSENTIFVTFDNQGKRRDYEDSVVKVFYLSNLTTPQELQEVTTTLRTVADIRKVFTYNTLNAIIVRGTSDQVLLAEKLVNDLDRPKSEVIVDVILMEASRNKTRNLAATLMGSDGLAGLNQTIGATPRTSLQSPSVVPTALPPPTATPNGWTPTPTPTSPAPGTTISSTSSVLLSNLHSLTGSDFSVNLPGAQLQAAMSDINAKVLQSPQIRASNGQKATLRIGQKVPVASGGVQPLSGTASGVSSLYSQFQFIDVGVNVDITPTVHYGTDEITLKLMLEVSQVLQYTTIGGIQQPIIGQDKIEHEIRIKEGEVSMIAGLMQSSVSKTIGGIPGLTSIPILKHLSSDSSVDSSDELIIVLIPHILRTPGIGDINLRSIAAGTDAVVRVNLEPLPAETPQPATTSPVSQPSGPPVEPPVAQPSGPTGPPPGSPGVMLMLVPQTVQASPGAKVTLQLAAVGAHDLAGAPFDLRFDPRLLKLIDVQKGDLLSRDGKDLIFTRNILNDNGACTVNLNRTPGAGGVSGDGTLATFTFEALKPGETTLSFARLTAIDSKLQPVPVVLPMATVTIR
ncbi:MAG: cohesin domain-containing protein [Bryobacteraceae bacterium]